MQFNQKKKSSNINAMLHLLTSKLFIFVEFQLNEKQKVQTQSVVKAVTFSFRHVKFFRTLKGGCGLLFFIANMTREKRESSAAGANLVFVGFSATLKIKYEWDKKDNVLHFK